MDVSTAMGRGVMGGVAQFNRENGGRWEVSFFPHQAGGSVPEWLKGWKGHGVLGCVDTAEVGEVLMRSGLPVVNVGEVGGVFAGDVE